MSSLTIVGRCAGCGEDLAVDADTVRWTGGTGLYCPDHVDSDDPGAYCRDGVTEGEPHELYVEPTRSELSQARAPILGYDGTFCDRCGYQSVCPDCVGS